MPVRGPGGLRRSWERKQSVCPCFPARPRVVLRIIQEQQEVGKRRKGKNNSLCGSLPSQEQAIPQLPTFLPPSLATGAGAKNELRHCWC